MKKLIIPMTIFLILNASLGFSSKKTITRKSPKAKNFSKDNRKKVTISDNEIESERFQRNEQIMGPYPIYLDKGNPHEKKR